MSRLQVAIALVVAAFLAGIGVALRWRDIEDAPTVHREHEQRIRALERAVCTLRQVAAEDCDGYWRARR